MLKNYKLKAFALLLLAGSVLGSCDYLDIAPAEIMTEDNSCTTRFGLYVS